jgi:hypothetical protein
MKLTGRNGVLRILDSAEICHGVAPLDSITPKILSIWGYSGGEGDSLYILDVTANAKQDDASVATEILRKSAYLGAYTPNNSGSYIAIGSSQKFNRIRFLKGNGTNYGVGGGPLQSVRYSNGGAGWAIVPAYVNTMDSGNNALAQDGYISFAIPRDWILGHPTAEPIGIGDALDHDKYWLLLKYTGIPTTAPDADVFNAVNGQFFEVAFAGMDFSGPIGRKLQEELLVLDRNTMSSRGHYVKGPDSPLYEPVPISFSCMIDDTHNKDDIMEALACGNPGSASWTATGTSSKGDTKNDGSISNPAFVDTNKKCVNLQIVWTGTYPIGMAYYECYFPPEEITIAEAEDGITLSANGGCYGVIETMHGFGNRY